MKMKRFYSLLIAVLMVFCVLSVTGCRKNEEPKTGVFYLYYKDVSAMNLYPVEGYLDEDLRFEDRVAAVFQKLCEPDKRSYMSPIPEKVQILSATLSENRLIFDFSSSYNTVSAQEEILMRAAVVKTFTQIPEVSTVEFRVEGQPLVLSSGTIPGAMKSSDFKDIFGSGLNAYTETRVVLYFANESGDRLRRTARELYYSNQISVEQCAIQQLITGPQTEAEGLPVLPNTLKINSVTVRDGVCYVDFGADFLSQAVPVNAEIIIFSIVDTLTEIPEVTSVRISVDSNADVSFKDTVDLSQLLYRNLDFIETSTNMPVTESTAP